MSATTDELVRRAGRLADAGDWQAAEQLWLEVHSRRPDHPQALFSLGVHALERDDLAGARRFLESARAAAPNDLLVLITLSAAYRLSGQTDAEREAIHSALTLDPYFLPALLAKAGCIERTGNRNGAVAAYRNALTVAPPRERWPAALRAQLEHATLLVDRHSRAFDSWLNERLAPLLAPAPSSVAERWREAASILAGRSRPFHSNCNQLHVPRLAARPFYERADFPWLAALEERTEVIRAECAEILRDDDGLTPYIAYRPGEPVNQWRELNHSPRWSAFHLWRDGSPVRENLERCPQTARMLDALSLADIPGLCPNAMFSVLAPRTRIPPHHGETNARLVAHLPLIVPEKCSLRVGFEERCWIPGEALIFDDTIEHEARNDSDELRVVLIFDVWNPLLTATEQGLVRAITAAAREFGSGAPPA